MQRRRAILLSTVTVLTLAVVGLMAVSYFILPIWDIMLPEMNFILVDCNLPELNPPGSDWDARCRCSDLAALQALGTPVAQGACWDGTPEPTP